MATEQASASRIADAPSQGGDGHDHDECLSSNVLAQKANPPSSLAVGPNLSVQSALHAQHLELQHIQQPHVHAGEPGAMAEAVQATLADAVAAAAAAVGELQAGSMAQPQADASASEHGIAAAVAAAAAAAQAAEDLLDDPVKLREELQKCQKHMEELSERWEYAMRVSCRGSVAREAVCQAYAEWGSGVLTISNQAWHSQDSKEQMILLSIHICPVMEEWCAHVPASASYLPNRGVRSQEEHPRVLQANSQHRRRLSSIVQGGKYLHS